MYEVEANRLVPLLTPLFFGWIISLTTRKEAAPLSLQFSGQHYFQKINRIYFCVYFFLFAHCSLIGKSINVFFIYFL
jgi:hypothetical protein